MARKPESPEVRQQRREARELERVVENLLRSCSEARTRIHDKRARQILVRVQARISLLLYGREISIRVN